MTIVNVTRGVLKLWPIVLYLAVLLMIDVVLFAVMCNAPLFSAFIHECLITSFLTAVISQAGIFCVLGGFLCRAWTKGFLISALLSTLFFGSTTLVILFSENWHTRLLEPYLIGLLIVPGILFAGSVPLMLYRAIFGCSLTRITAEPYAKPRIRLEGILILTTVVAAILMSMIAPMRLMANQSEVKRELTLAVLSYYLMATGASSIGVLPVSVLYLGAKSRASRLRWLVFFAGLSLVATWMITLLLAGGIVFWGRNGLFVPCLVSIGSATIFSLGLIAMHASGLRLVYHPRADAAPVASEEASTDPFLDPQATSNRTAVDSVRWQNRFAAGVIVLVAGLAITGVQVNLWRKESVANRQEQLQADLYSRGGGLKIEYGQVLAARLPADATNESVRSLEDRETMLDLVLAHSQINDDIISNLSRFPMLRSLDLSHTNFSDEGLKKLHRPLSTLRLAGTKVTPEGVKNWLAAKKVDFIDLGELQLTDENVVDICQFKGAIYSGISLKGNPITDKSLVALADFTKIDLSDTNMDGTGLSSLKSVQDLILDGTKVTDQTLVPLLQSKTGMSRLSLKRTDVSFSTLTALSSIASLELGEGLLDDDAISRIDLPVSTLKLQSRQFTGKSFRQRKSQIRILDMSGSGMDDEGIPNLANLVALRTLNLSDTMVSDQGLKELAKLKVQSIHLSRTKVTAEGLMKSGIVGVTILVAPNQFTREQLSMLNSKMIVKIDSGIE